MQGVVKKWGNSAAVRIPSSVLEAAHVQLDQPVDIREEQGRLRSAGLRLGFLGTTAAAWPG